MNLTFRDRKQIRISRGLNEAKLSIMVLKGCKKDVGRYVTRLTDTTAHCVDCGKVNFNCSSNECNQESCSLHERFRRV
jgi:hypothetical protein